jgi:peptidoglycan hydrolase FlgJ
VSGIGSTGPAPLVGSAGNAAADRSRLATADNMKAATEKFEAIFIGMMLKSMRSTQLGEDLLGSSAMSKFREVQDEKLAASMSKGMPLGLGTALGKFLTKAEPSLTASQPAAVTVRKAETND